MHRKKIPRVIFGRLLHSIPRLKDKKKYPNLSFNYRSKNLISLRYLSSGIPLACIMALLLLSIIMINPNVSDSYALSDTSNNDNSTTATTQNTGGVEEGVEVDTNDGKSEENVDAKAESNSEDENVDSEKSETETIDDKAVNDANEVNSDSEIMTLAVMPSASLTITPGSGGNGAGVSDATVVTPGATAYRSHNIAVNIKDATNYVLQINSTTNSSGLKLEGGNFTLSGASGQTGTNLADYTWGFAWGNTTDVDSNMAYYALPVAGATGSGVSTGRLEAGSGSSVNFTKKLVFGAKFGANAITGRYKTSAILSLAAAPLGVTKLSEMTHMQQMTSEICANSNIGDTKTGVIDIRDNSTYSIARLNDGKCWMTQNLRLVNKVIMNSDSDVSSNYTVPASSLSNFSSNSVYYNNDTTNGAYYGWCVATAGTCPSGYGTTDSSICPKGWKLPVKAEYDALIGKGYGDLSTITTNKGLTIGGGLFSASGWIDWGSFRDVGSGGYYWANGIGYGSSTAYGLNFNDSSVTTEWGSWSRGYSVRCIAR